MRALSAPRCSLPENPNLIAGKLGETFQKTTNKSKNAGYSPFLGLVTRIKDAGIAIRHSQGYIISVLQGPEMSLGAVDTHLKGS